jgi:hypothetical protein
MGDAGFGLTQCQSNAGKPLLYQIATVFDHTSVPVQNHQIIGVHDDLRLPVELTPRFFWVPSRPGWKLSPNMRFESVQGDVGQKRRQDATLRRSGLRFDKHPVVKNPGLKPSPNQLAEGRERLDLSQKSCLVNAIKRSNTLIPLSTTHR